ncbi:MAG: phosphoribosyltransferase family protein [Ketobacteraceae bacterium]|nr:phosphoribosyltransferase family protein [Ketobacteraceae bacterium]
MKYGNKPQLSRLLVELAFGRGTEARRKLTGSPLPEVLIPVPMHPRKQRQRGFNQAIYLAKQFGKQHGIRVVSDALQKSRSTDAQNPLTAEQRQNNLRGAFRVNPKRISELTRCDSVGLVDDVITTGATMTEICHTLQDAGVAEVHLIAIARTP